MIQMVSVMHHSEKNFKLQHPENKIFQKLEKVLKYTYSSINRTIAKLKFRKRFLFKIFIVKGNVGIISVLKIFIF